MSGCEGLVRRLPSFLQFEILLLGKRPLQYESRPWTGVAVGVHLESACPPVEGGSGHSKIPGDLRVGFAAVNEADGVADLAVSDLARPAPETAASFAAFIGGVGDAFAFDLVFHLSECSQDREEHRAQGCCWAKESMFCVDRPRRSRVVMTRVSIPLSNAGRDARAPETPRST